LIVGTLTLVKCLPASPLIVGTPVTWK